MTPWPAPIGQVSRIPGSLPGEFLRLVEPHTEADSAALLVQFLVAFGCVVGRGPYFLTDGVRQHTNEYAAIVGKSAVSRKGTSLWHVKCRFPEWPLGTGLSSGEGLMWAIRDGIEGDEGVSDKRLTVVQAELASTLRVMGREGNSLSGTLREAWDDGNLRSMTKNSPAKATGAHISMIGHGTIEELRRYLTATEQANGFANRILWVLAKRSQELPDGGSIGDVDFGPFNRMLGSAIKGARELKDQRFRRDAEATALWRQEYGALTNEERDGMLGHITSRAPAHVVRLSLIYALLDGEKDTIRRRHLRAALEVWRYCDDSARCIFGDATGDAHADKLVDALKRSERLSRTVISSILGRHATAAKIDSYRADFEDRGWITCETEKTGGAPIEWWTPTSLISLNSQPRGEA